MRPSALLGVALLAASILLVRPLSHDARAADEAPPAEPWRDRFLIGGWQVNDAPIDPKRLVLMGEAGLDYVQNQDHSGYPQFSRRLVSSLDSLRKVRPGFDLQAVLHFSAPAESAAKYTNNPSAGAHTAEIRRLLRRGAGFNSPSVLGWALWDEPCATADMKTLGDVTRALRADPATANGLPYVNLIPIAAPDREQCFDAIHRAKGGRADRYRAYLDSYLDQFDDDALPAPVLSFDLYPFEEPGKPTESSWFEALDIAARTARDHSRPGRTVPLWVIVQLSPWKKKGKPWPDTPTFAQTRWQAWTALAYGARSISYYTIGIVFNPRNDQGWGAGILEYSGAKTVRYDSLKTLNAELKPVGVRLAGTERIGTLLGSGKIDRFELRKDSGSKDAVLGVFKTTREGERYLLVVNASFRSNRTFQFVAGSGVTTAEWLRGTSSQRLEVKSGSFKSPALPPGRAALIRVSG